MSTIDNYFRSPYSHHVLYITILIKIMLVACLIKNYFVITYLLEDEQELSLGMLICVKRIYNFWVIHANFVMLSHVSIIISHHFYAFWWTNLLTRCPVLVFCFCPFRISESAPQEISSELPGNLRRFLCEELHLKTKGEPQGPPTGCRRPPAATLLGPAGGARPCSWGTPSAPSDAYKIPKNLKTSRRPLFSRNSTPTRRHQKP